MPHNSSDFQDVLTNWKRLKALERADILDTPNEKVFDDLTQNIREDLDVPVSLISIVDLNRQFFKSQQGMPADIVKSRETPINQSICQTVVQQGETLAVTDLNEDPLYFNHPALRDLNVVAYLGEPLYYDGEVIGSVCAIDTKPKKWTDEDKRRLRERTKAIQAEVDTRGKSKES